MRGEFSIEPPLKLSEIRDSDFLPADEGNLQLASIELLLSRAERETDAEVITTITCDRVVPWTSAPCNPGDLLESVRVLIAECQGHKISGQIVLYDEDHLGCVSRVIVDESGAREERAELVWPDGSKAKALQ